MERKKLSKYLKTALKIVITIVAIWIVFRKIDVDETVASLTSADPFWLVMATIFFTASKVVSSFRLNRYFKSIDVQLSETYNLRLYFIGMFYNLFLPGGIGGDGYKVYLVNKYYKISVKQLVAATLIDRISGLAALLFLALGLLLFVPLEHIWFGMNWLVIVALILVIPAYYIFNKILFPSYLKVFWSTGWQSLAVQGLQVICALFILWSLGIGEKYIEYQALFLISSIVAVLPFTIGGVGARELTFILGHEYLGIDKNLAVAFSLLFFLITAFISFIGAFLKVGEPHQEISGLKKISTDT